MNITGILGKILLVTALICGYSASSVAQNYVNAPVNVSKEKVRINGKVCYSHVVLEKQTLFSISKAYNVSIDDIYRLNPTLKQTGLKKNSIILIPVTEAAPVQQPVQQTQKQQQEKPVMKKQEELPEPEKADKTIHTVKWFENIDDIARKYGVTAEEIIAANELKGRRLKSRMKLIIPEPGEYAAVRPAADSLAAHTADSTAAGVQEPVETVIPHIRKNKVTASLLMPFRATGTSSSRNNMDFYSGVLMAINDLAVGGTGTDLNVHDTASENEIPKTELEESDVIIGPVSNGEISLLLGLNPQSMIVSPLDPKVESLTDTNDKLIQAPTPHKIQYDDLAAWIKEDSGPEDHIILITEKGARQTEAILQMKESIDSSGIAYKSFSYSILEGRDVQEPLSVLMTQNAVNRVVITSESEAFVNDVVRNLNVMIHHKYNVVLYAGSKIRSYETIEAENFHNTNLHVSLTYFIDYTDPRVKNFLLKYRALFNAEPSQFAFQGYDIASYFIDLCAEYGDNWTSALPDNEKSMLQGTFKFVRKENGGFVNNGVRRIVYGKDWGIVKVK